MKTVLKILFGVLFILLESGYIVTQEHSKVWKDAIINHLPTDYVLPQFYDPYTRTHIESSVQENGTHLKYLEITLPLNSNTIVLDLRLNTYIMSEDFKQIHYENGNEKVAKPNFQEINYCHYTGRVKSEDESWVALSTCDGISGIIYNKKKIYIIKKSNDSDSHHIYMTPRVPYEENILRTRKKREATHNILGGPYTENVNSLFIELVLVFDKGVYDRLGSLTEVTNYAMAITNLVNAMYSRVNIFVILVGVVIWTEKNEFILQTGSVLNNFTTYVRTKLVQKYSFDSAHLISSVNVITPGVGVAWTASICYTATTGVNDDLKNALSTAMTVTHELGHNLGLKHDTPDCTCPDEQCIMVDLRHSDTITHFSSCSMKVFRDSYENESYFCLRNKPAVISNVYENCGNGILEPGEECDCGLLGYCDNSCCNPLTCKFTNDSECASGPCCNLLTCRLKDAATECRSSSNECDLPEYCTGDSHECPRDTFKLETEECNDGKSYCHQGFCGIGEKCTTTKNIESRNLLQCYSQDSRTAMENNYCKSNTFSDTYFRCGPSWSRFLTCSQPKYETLEFELGAITIYSSVFGQKGSFVICTVGMMGRVHNISVCDTKETECMRMSDLRQKIPKCPVDCNNNGWCNNKGHCHCKDGYAPPNCYAPGFGGSWDSGPSVNPYGLTLARNIMFIIFLGIVPLIAGFAVTIYLILGEYGSCGTFLKAMLTRKTAVPTISQHIDHHKQPFGKRNVNYVSAITPTDLKNNVPINILKVNQPRPTPLRVSAPFQEQPKIFLHNSDQSKDWPIYENLRGVQKSGVKPKIQEIKNELSLSHMNKYPVEQIKLQVESTMSRNVPKSLNNDDEVLYENITGLSITPYLADNRTEHNASQGNPIITSFADNEEAVCSNNSSLYKEFSKRKKKLNMYSTNTEKQIVTPKTDKEMFHPNAEKIMEKSNRKGVKDMIRKFDPGNT